MGPAVVSTLTAITLWPQLPVDVILIGLGVAMGPMFAVLARWKSWSAIPFSFGFWSFAFPLAATSSCIIEAVVRSAGPHWVAQTAMLFTTTLVFFLMGKTLMLLIKGKLF
jgi:tellurite resistance protein